MKGIRQSSGASDKVFNAFNITIMILVMLVTLYPFWYVIVCSFSSITHVTTSNFILWPDGIHLEAYQQIFRDNLVPTAYKNTLFITLTGTVLSMVLTILGAYVLSRRDLPGRKFLTIFVVLTMLFKGGLVPFYLQVQSVGLLESLWALVLPFLISTYNMIIMRNFFFSVPESLYESASLDGCRPTGYLLRILIPLSMPSIATITLFYAVSYWNSYFYGIIFLQNKTLWPMQTVLRQILMSSEFSTMLYDDGAQNLPSEVLKDAMIVITAMPIICVYPFLQKYFVKGIMVGSIKG